MINVTPNFESVTTFKMQCILQIAVCIHKLVYIISSHVKQLTKIYSITKTWKSKCSTELILGQTHSNETYSWEAALTQAVLIQVLLVYAALHENQAAAGGKYWSSKKASASWLKCHPQLAFSCATKNPDLSFVLRAFLSNPLQNGALIQNSYEGSVL